LYNLLAETELHTDACSSGLGGVLLQKQPNGLFAAIAYFRNGKYIYTESIVEKKHRRIAMDATGSFVSKIQIANGSQSDHIVLYVLYVVNIKGLIIPVHEMISEKHDINSIEYWIKE